MTAIAGSRASSIRNRLHGCRVGGVGILYLNTGVTTRIDQLDSMVADHDDVIVAKHLAGNPARVDEGPIPALEIDNNDRVPIANQKRMLPADVITLNGHITQA